MAKVPIIVIAKALDTSVQVIQDFYAKHLGARNESIEMIRGRSPVAGSTDRPQPRRQTGIPLVFDAN